MYIQYTVLHTATLYYTAMLAFPAGPSGLRRLHPPGGGAEATPNNTNEHDNNDDNDK